MSIQDIIEAARVSSESSGESWAEYYDCPEGIEASFPYIEPDDARFIATFDPEHVALMEAVCEAEDNGTDDELTTAGAALQAYRKEHGL